jgi:hypothetical protein
MTQLEFEEKDKLRLKEYRKALKEKIPPKPFHWGELSQGERAERYLEKATEIAEAVIEQERQNYVDARFERDIGLIKSVAKRLRYQVLIVEDGKPVKLKMGIEMRNVSDHKGGWIRQQVLFVGDHDTEKLEHIFRLKHQLTKLKDFVTYYPDEVKKIYGEALSIASLEVMENEKAKT